MLDSTGILDKDLKDLAKKATKMFQEKMNIANQAINNMPDSEGKKKAQLKTLLKSAKNTKADHKSLLKQLTKIMND